MVERWQPEEIVISQSFHPESGVICLEVSARAFVEEAHDPLETEDKCKDTENNTDVSSQDT